MIKLSAKTYKKGKDTARREEKKIDLNKTQPVIQEVTEIHLDNQNKIKIEKSIGNNQINTVTSQEKSPENKKFIN